MLVNGPDAENLLFDQFIGIEVDSFLRDSFDDIGS